MTLNEYGVFQLDSGERVAGTSEEDVYEALGLRWIAPEQREGRGEIAAASLGASGPTGATQGSLKLGV